MKPRQYPDPQALGLRQLRSDPQFPRIAPERRPRLVESALRDGRFLAADVKCHMGSDPASIAADCGVPVIDSEENAGFGTTMVFAEYGTRPPSITLYGPALETMDAALAESPIGRASGLLCSRPVFLAHELYHHFDCCRRVPLARRHRVRLFGVGRWAWTSGLASLPEIAAGAFAQELLGLPFHPKLLDSLLTRA